MLLDRLYEFEKKVSKDFLSEKFIKWDYPPWPIENAFDPSPSRYGQKMTTLVGVMCT